MLYAYKADGELGNFCDYSGYLGEKRKENDSSGELLTRRYEICSNLILSPQQYRILFDSKKTHLIITGQPGSGKTTLLLAKCEELTYSESLEKIYFIYSEEKILFKKYLKKALGKCCSRRLENEITLVGLQPQNLYSFVAELKNRKKEAVMIDEIEADTILCDSKVLDILSEFKYCWISFIETGKDTYLDMNSVFPEQFDHEDLNILFRSACHISSITNNNITENIDKSTPFPSKPVRMPGCFTAAQKEIEVTEVDKIENTNRSFVRN
ncbi:uncharacterized protein LOC142335824 [Convolutriloba macropyga]|uniref:uncharacterized protein LOC142335824 n=1 Tax=Convolutriloba macropyga TaxID=536237 RepID=UPI003F527F37